jgi:hypothetical protein
MHIAIKIIIIKENDSVVVFRIKTALKDRNSNEAEFNNC